MTALVGLIVLLFVLPVMGALGVGLWYIIFLNDYAARRKYGKVEWTSEYLLDKGLKDFWAETKHEGIGIMTVVYVVSGCGVFFGLLMLYGLFWIIGAMVGA